MFKLTPRYRERAEVVQEKSIESSSALRGVETFAVVDERETGAFEMRLSFLLFQPTLCQIQTPCSLIHSISPLLKQHGF